MQSKKISAFSKFYIKIRPKIIPFPLIEKNVSKEGTIIDIGCGFGVFAHYLAEKSQTRSVIGIDINESRIKQAKIIYDDLVNLKFFCRDITDIKIPVVDEITAIDVLHHIPSTDIQSKLLTACFSALKENGKLIIKDVDKRPLWKYWWNWIHDFIMTKGEPVLYQDQKSIVKLLKNSGFQLEFLQNLKGYPYAHVIYVAKKSK